MGFPRLWTGKWLRNRLKCCYAMSSYRLQLRRCQGNTTSPKVQSAMSPQRESLAEFLTKAEPSVQLILQNEHARGWGPVVRTQFDSRSEPIQTYTMALLRTPTGRWIGVRCIFNVVENQSAPPLVSHLSLQSAIRWLTANGFPIPDEFAADDSCETEESIDEMESWRQLAVNPPEEKMRA